MPISNINTASHFSSDKMQKNSLFMSDHLFCDVYCLEPGQEQHVHTHSESDKIYYVLEGTGTFTLGHNVSAQKSGDIVYAPANVAHGVANKSRDRLRCLVLMAPPPNH